MKLRAIASTRPRRGVPRGRGDRRRHCGRTVVECHGRRGRGVRRQSDAGSAAEGRLPVRVCRAVALELHPDRGLSAQRPDDQGDDRGAAPARARSAQGRPEPAGLSDGDGDHGSRNRARRPRAAGAGRRRPRRGRCAAIPCGYFFSVFGTPSTKSPWGWRVEGHHVSLHFTVVNGTLVASSPSFFGSNPAEVREGPKKGLRILGDQEDAARALLTALDAQQRAKAVIQSVALNEIVTTNKVDINPLSPVGIMAADAMTPKQREMLMKVIDAYTSKMADDIAADRTAKLRKAGLEKIAFAWAGEPNAARSTTTASRARRSSSSTTTRRTTATTSIRSGATSTATSGGTCCGSTSPRRTDAFWPNSPGESLASHRDGRGAPPARRDDREIPGVFE